MYFKISKFYSFPIVQNIFKEVDLKFSKNKHDKMHKNEAQEIR